MGYQPISHLVVTPWKKWFAWRPVKVNGKTVWLEYVYRRMINGYVDFDDWTRYEYGTIFDVIKTAKIDVLNDVDTPRAG